MGVYDHILVPLEGSETDASVLEHVGRAGRGVRQPT